MKSEQDRRSSGDPVRISGVQKIVIAYCIFSTGVL
jgi:hypothetical protein